MQIFVDYCYNTLARSSGSTAVLKHQSGSSPSRSTSPVISPIIEYNCCNLYCLNSTDLLQTWKHVKYNKKRLYFCTEDCWQQWADTPSQIGSWSPPDLPREQIEEIEAFQLNQSTIESKGGLE